MPFDRPDLTTLKERIEADFAARLPGGDAKTRRSNLNVMARVSAGAVHGIQGFIEWVSKQTLPDTAEVELLDRHGGIWGVTRKAAVYAQGSVDFTGQDGSAIPAGTLLQRADATEYATDALVTIASGTATAAVTAVKAGDVGNAAAATALSLVSPIAGVTSAALVAAGGLTSGEDEEADEALRTRITDRIQQPPHGGADFDYTKWALEVAGVTRAWVFAKELGIGTVTVRFMMDDTYGDGIPQATDVTTVQTYIDAARPVTADLTVAAPAAVPLDVNISGLDPVSQTVKDAIEAELADLVRREASPGATILISHIREAISIAAGEKDHVLVSPAADVTHTTGQIAVPGTVTWS